MGTDHVEDYALAVVDILASDERVAVIARTTGRIGGQGIANDFVQVIRVDGGRVSEVWNYNWDQHPARRGHARGGLTQGRSPAQ